MVSMNPGSRFIDDFLFWLCTLLLLLTRLILSIGSVLWALLSIVPLDSWPFDLISYSLGGGGREFTTGLTILFVVSTYGWWWFISVKVRLQHGISSAESITADIVNWFNCVLPADFFLESWTKIEINKDCIMQWL